MEDGKNKFTEKIRSSRQAVNEVNERSQGLSRSSMDAASQKVTIPKPPQLDRAEWDKNMETRGKNIDARLQKNATPQAEHKVSAVQQKAQKDTTTKRETPAKAAPTKGKTK